MTDTIELLETIGSDASLRYASAGELMGVLEQAQASAELATAVASGDSAPLREELGIKQAAQLAQSNEPGFGDDDEGEADAPQPERDDPSPPATPDASH